MKKVSSGGNQFGAWEALIACVDHYTGRKLDRSSGPILELVNRLSNSQETRGASKRVHSILQLVHLSGEPPQAPTSNDDDAVHALRGLLGSWTEADDQHPHIDTCITQAQPHADAVDAGDGVSLHHQSRIVAAVAACLHADGALSNGIPPLDSSFRLLCLNMSGVQDFIYSVATKRATKALKGRSFALQLLMESAAWYFCDQCGLPRACTIYAGGGRAYLLLPNSANVEIPRRSLNRALQSAFSGQLALHCGETNVTLGSLYEGKAFASSWREASVDASRQRHRVWSEMAIEDYDSIFGNLAPSGVRDDNPEGENEPDDPETSFYAELGREVRLKDWVALSSGSANGNEVFLHRFFAELGLQFSLCHSMTGASAKDTRLLIRLGQFEDSDWEGVKSLVEVPIVAMPLARAWPRNGENVRTFEELAEQSRGTKKLAVLRADVDNLGAVFAHGLGDNAGPGRVAALSGALSRFFEVELDALANEPPFNESVGVVYAGGDDLFIVGAWNATLDFLFALRKRFDETTGNNPHLSFSAGVVIADPHIPLRYLADMAAEAEEAAKGYERNGATKNAVCILGDSIGFEEWERFDAFRALITRMLEDSDERKPMPAGFLRRLYEISEAYHREQQLLAERNKSWSMEEVRAKARWQRWRWLLVYGLRDFVKKQTEWKVEIEEVIQRLLNDAQPIEDRLGVPLRWTEMLIRREQENG